MTIDWSRSSPDPFEIHSLPSRPGVERGFGGDRKSCRKGLFWFGLRPLAGTIRLALPDRASPDKSREAGLKDPCLMNAGAFVTRAGSEHVDDI